MLIALSAARRFFSGAALVSIFYRKRSVSDTSVIPCSLSFDFLHRDNIHKCIC
nr:MAG TPA: hypothetical protein [Caudoviricetes sp.]